jgi:hypothetical protein
MQAMSDHLEYGARDFGGQSSAAAPDIQSALSELSRKISYLLAQSPLSPEMKAHAAIDAASRATNRAAIAPFNAAALLFDYANCAR